MLANLKHAARNGETLRIGGGIFTPDETRAFVDQTEQLLEMAHAAFGYLAIVQKDPEFKRRADLVWTFLNRS